MGVQAAQSGPHLLDGLLEEEEYCEQRKITIRTARKERQRCDASPWVKLGKKIYYLGAGTPEFQAWLKKRVQQSARGGEL
jgi:hypothetical protein